MSRLRYPGEWRERKRNSRLTVITAYDATMARLISSTSVDAILVGDSLGMVVQGHSSTLPVTLEEMVYHCRMVRRGAPDRFLIADMPFGSYQTDISEGMKNCIHVLKASGVEAVKVEGATEDVLKLIRRLTAHGVPVMGHIGLTPQAYLNLGGFHARGRAPEVASALLEDAKNLQNAGCFSTVLELITSDLAAKITESLEIPTIGIGSGVHTSGQVLVLNDILGLDERFQARHVKVYASLAPVIRRAVEEYCEDVVAGKFPEEKHGFS